VGGGEGWWRRRRRYNDNVSRDKRLGGTPAIVAEEIYVLVTSVARSLAGARVRASRCLLIRAGGRRGPGFGTREDRARPRGGTAGEGSPAPLGARALYRAF